MSEKGFFKIKNHNLFIIIFTSSYLHRWMPYVPVGIKETKKKKKIDNALLRLHQCQWKIAQVILIPKTDKPPQTN